MIGTYRLVSNVCGNIIGDNYLEWDLRDEGPQSLNFFKVLLKPMAHAQSHTPFRMTMPRSYGFFTLLDGKRRPVIFLNTLHKYLPSLENRFCSIFVEFYCYDKNGENLQKNISVFILFFHYARGILCSWDNNIVKY